MVQIPMISGGPLSKQSVLSINQMHVQGPKSSHNITSINNGILREPPLAAHTSSQNAAPSDKPTPALHHTIRKGQKLPLETQGKLAGIDACLGWNTLNAACAVAAACSAARDLAAFTCAAVYYAQLACDVDDVAAAVRCA